jgi:hypothetical protein
MAINIVTGAQAHANVAVQPCNVMLYGAPGTEKTTDAVKAFIKNGRCTAFYIPCEDGALKPILARGLPIPDHPELPVKSWPAMTETIGWLAQHRGNYSAVVVDTLSTFMMYLNKEVEVAKGSKNGYEIWNAMRAALYNIREWIRMLGLHSVFICHGIGPEVKEGIFNKGGPLLAPKTMIEQYYGLVDTVLRVDHLHAIGRPPMRVYWTGGETWPTELSNVVPPPDWRMWRTKNREGCGSALVPADLGAFLRSRTPPYDGL